MATSSAKSETRPKTLPKGGVLLLEGIFAFQERLTEPLDASAFFRIFICPLSVYNTTEQTFMSNQRLRLLRRVSRDFLHRGRHAAQSILRTGVVRTGEEQNILPVLPMADYIADSGLPHELAVMTPFCRPLLSRAVHASAKGDKKQEAHEQHASVKAVSLMETLDAFYPVGERHLAATSVLREFAGGSAFE
jgi:uridine kinase